MMSVAPPGGKADDDAHRPRRIIFGRSEVAWRGQYGGARDQMQKSASGKLQANTRVNVITILEADKNVFRRTMLAPSARLHRRHHLDARQHDAAPVPDFGAAVSVGKDRW